jgi:hypothetical protein
LNFLNYPDTIIGLFPAKNTVICYEFGTHQTFYSSYIRNRRMEEKKQIERLLLEGFRTFYPDFPKGKLVPSESPDFIMRTKSNHYLGIELTRLHPKVISDLPEKDMEIIRIEEEVVERTAEIFSYHTQIPVFIKILFSSDKTINPGRIITVSAKAAQVIRKYTAEKEGDGFSSKLINQKDLPEGISSVLILRHPQLIVPVWERANNIGFSGNIPDDIRFSIQKKDDKLGLYHKRKLNIYWLLITADQIEGISSYNFENTIFNHSYSSGFQHVFLYELMKERVFILV